MTQRDYVAEPTPIRFHADDSFVRGIMGPIGSGKSVACVIEIIARSLRQAPDSQRRRRTRWAVIRNTYPELTSTTLKTWREWLPDSVCPIVCSSPIRGFWNHALLDGTRVEMEVFFLALNLPKDIKKLLSLELTGAWINEARELDKTIIDGVTSRVGRFPAKIDGDAGITWSGVIMDTNPPDDLHWWYQAAEEQDHPGWRFFRQPPALLDRGDGDYAANPAAENMKNHSLGSEYWLRQVSGKSREWIKVYLLGEYGTVQAGKAIYAEAWQDSIHASPVALSPLPRHEIVCGWDWGLTPACIIAQVTPRGQLMILDEVIGENTGVQQFAENFVLPLLRTRYRDCPQSHIGDPAGNQRSQTDERTVFEELRRLGIDVTPAPSNSPLARLEAVRGYLSRMVDGRPGLFLSPTCKTLRKGFNGGYRYRQLQISGETRYQDQPDKNHYSHCHDALGYLCLWLSRAQYSAPETLVALGAAWRPPVVCDVVAGY